MKISVLVITYNHEKFITQTLESVLMQRGAFEYEIVIGDDCSQDSTREILSNYQKKYPDKIRLLLPEKNLGMNKNFESTFMACQGEYIALLDGDDYWLSPYKLQKQLQFLQENQEYVLCFHKVLNTYDDGRQKIWKPCSSFEEWLGLPLKKSFTLSDLLKNNFIPTSAGMFRAGLLTALPQWFCTLGAGDWPLFILLAHFGPIGFINEVLGVYRIHSSGVWTKKDPTERHKLIIHILQIIDRHFNYQYHEEIKQKIAWHYFKLAYRYGRKRAFGNAMASFGEGLAFYFSRSRIAFSKEGNSTPPGG